MSQIIPESVTREADLDHFHAVCSSCYGSRPICGEEVLVTLCGSTIKASLMPEPIPGKSVYEPPENACPDCRMATSCPRCHEGVTTR